MQAPVLQITKDETSFFLLDGLNHVSFFLKVCSSFVPRFAQPFDKVDRRWSSLLFDVIIVVAIFVL